MNATIGRFDCPCCGKECDVRDSKKSKPYIVCTDDDCGFQGFARGEGAAIKMRARMKPLAQAVAAALESLAAPAPVAPLKKSKGMWDGIWPEE